ncbi:hypothetical protein [Protaetiibacter intestinalis]|uniref:Uncharacterized protein n=1 Tax=Protaetiibacter intestinalis TaxID=2419774 RepID=A0A387B7F8_9MICO|nr:hypothetical protein [Protaetiibacter intestinalis]AYF97125.1 hypothetical protein D7I47_01920 [Protaetiibacter intestinalis]
MTVELPEPDETVGTPERAWPLPAIVVAVVFGLLYAWFLYQAIGNLLNVPPAYENAGFGERIPWALLVVGAAFPVLAFAAAAWLGVRRTLTHRVLVFAAGLAATSATALSLYVVSAYLVTVG